MTRTSEAIRYPCVTSLAESRRWTTSKPGGTLGPSACKSAAFRDETKRFAVGPAAPAAPMGDLWIVDLAPAPAEWTELRAGLVSGTPPGGGASSMAAVNGSLYIITGVYGGSEQACLRCSDDAIWAPARCSALPEKSGGCSLLRVRNALLASSSMDQPHSMTGTKHGRAGRP